MLKLHNCNSKNNDSILCNVVIQNSKNKTKVKKVASVTVDNTDESNNEEIEIDDNHFFRLTPATGFEEGKFFKRDVLFVAGESGAGKSFYTARFADEYKKIHPKSEVYLISYLDKDESLDSLKYLKRLNITPEFIKEISTFTSKDVEEEFSNCFVIFDDIDSITNKKTKDIVYGLLNKLLKIGRHYGTTVAYLGHELYSSHELKCILNESHYITIFPKYLNYKKIKYLLEIYLGLSKEQINKLTSIKNTRPIKICKGFPKVIITDHLIYYL